jgi:hypothetical protein
MSALPLLLLLLLLAARSSQQSLAWVLLLLLLLQGCHLQLCWELSQLQQQGCLLL